MFAVSTTSWRGNARGGTILLISPEQTAHFIVAGLASLQLHLYDIEDVQLLQSISSFQEHILQFVQGGCIFQSSQLSLHDCVLSACETLNADIASDARIPSHTL
eukprot:scaffold211544_cov37-Prasinocladus_malaysianus.AAC.1